MPLLHVITSVGCHTPESSTTWTPDSWVPGCLRPQVSKLPSTRILEYLNPRILELPTPLDLMDPIPFFHYLDSLHPHTFSWGFVLSVSLSLLASNYLLCSSKEAFGYILHSESPNVDDNDRLIWLHNQMTSSSLAHNWKLDRLCCCKQPARLFCIKMIKEGSIEAAPSFCLFIVKAIGTFQNSDATNKGDSRFNFARRVSEVWFILMFYQALKCGKKHLFCSFEH